MVSIDISALPAQTFQVVLDGQDCSVKLYSRAGSLYMDLAAAGMDICAGAICLNAVSITQFRSPYFKGSLYFIDTKGSAAPRWEELGTRFILIYLSEGEELPEGLL